MATPFLGEIRLFTYNFAPEGWAFCNGQILPIDQNLALFSLLGTTYGGDGRTTFALPNLQGRVALHLGPGYDLGEFAGELSHTLLSNEMPTHNHSLNVGALATSGDPSNAYFGTPDVPPREAILYSTTGAGAAYGETIGLDGSGQPHSNIQPILTLNYSIALEGIFPSRN
jgi:microcystin-dependent protein